MSRQIYRFRGLLALVTTCAFIATGAVVLWQASRNAEAAVAADVARFAAAQPFNITNNISIVPGTAATGTLTVNGVPANGETVTVGLTTYTFVGALSALPFVPNQVLIGGTNTASADNLRRAINNAGTAGSQYALGTAPNRDATAFVIGSQVTVIARIVGRAGNTLTLTGSANVAAAAFAGGTGGTAFVSNRQGNSLSAFNADSDAAANAFPALGASVGVGSVDAVGVGNGGVAGDDNDKFVVAVDASADVLRSARHQAGTFGAGLIASSAPGVFTNIDGRSNAVLYNADSGGGDFQAFAPQSATEVAVADNGANVVRFLNIQTMAQNGFVNLPTGSGPIWIDAKTFDSVAPIPVTVLGGGLARKIVVVANQAGNTISIFAGDTPDDVSNPNLALVGTVDLAAAGISGLSTWNNIVLAPDGTSAYLAIGGANRLIRIAIATNVIPAGTVTGTIIANVGTGINPQQIAVNPITGSVAVAVMGTTTPPGAGSVQIFPDSLGTTVTTPNVSINVDNNPAFGGPGSDFIYIADGTNGIAGFNATDGSVITPNGGPGAGAFWPPLAPIGAGASLGRIGSSPTDVAIIDKQTGAPNVFGAAVEHMNGINLGPRANGVAISALAANEGTAISLTPSWVDDDRNDLTSITGTLIGIGADVVSMPLDANNFNGTFGALANGQTLQRNIATRTFTFTPGLDTLTAGSVVLRFQFTGTDSQGATSTQIREVQINENGNGAGNVPTIDAVANQTVNEGGNVTVTVTTRDLDVSDRPVFKGAIGNPGPPYLSTFQIDNADGGDVAGNANLRTQFGIADAATHTIPNNASLSLQGGSNATGVNSAVLSFSPVAGTAGAKIRINLKSSDGANQSLVGTFLITVNQSNIAPTITFARNDSTGTKAQVRETPADPTTNADATFHAFEDVLDNTAAKRFRFQVTFNDANVTPAPAQTVAADVTPTGLRTIGTAVTLTTGANTITVTRVANGGITTEPTLGATGDDRALTAVFEVSGLDDFDGTNVYSLITFTATDSAATPLTTTNSVSIIIVDSNTLPTFAVSSVGTDLTTPLTLNENTTSTFVKLVRDTDASHTMAVDLLNAAGTAGYTTVNNVSIELGQVNAAGTFTSAGAGVTTVTLSALPSAGDGDFLADSFTGRVAVRITLTFNSAIDNTPSASSLFTLKARNTFNSQTKNPLGNTPGVGAPTGTSATTNSAILFGTPSVTINGRNVNRNPAIAFTSADQGNSALIVTGTNSGSTIPIGTPTESQQVGAASNTAGNVINRANMTMLRDQTIRIGAQSSDADTNVGTAGAPGIQGANELVTQGSSVTITRVTDASGVTNAAGAAAFTANVTILQPAQAATTTAPTLAGASAGPGVLQFPQSITSGVNNLATLVTGVTTADFYRIEFNAQDNTNFIANANTGSDIVPGRRVRSIVVKVIGPTNNPPNVNSIVPGIAAVNDNIKDAAHPGRKVRFISRFLDTSGAAPAAEVGITQPAGAAPNSAIAPLTDAFAAGPAGAGTDGTYSVTGAGGSAVATYAINQGTRLSFDLDDFASDFETNNATALGGSPAPLSFTVSSTIPGLSTTSGNLSGITPTAGQDPVFAGTTADEFNITPPFNTVIAGSTSAFFSVSVTITDTGGLSTTKQFIVEVFKRSASFVSPPAFTLINNAAPPGGGVFVSAAVRQGATINIPTEVADNNLPAGDVLTFSIQSGSLTGMTYATEGTNGAASPNGTTKRVGTFQWIVPANQTPATYVVQIRVVDLGGTPINFIFQIPVVVNTAPTATAQTINGQQKNTVATATLAGTDPEGDTLTFALSGAATGGSVTLAGNVATFTPTNNFTGAASFQFTVSDGLLTSTAATVTINYVNTAATATGTTPAGTQSVARNSPTGVTFALNGQGNDPAETVTFSIVTAPASGTLTGVAAGGTAVAGTGATSTASVNVTYIPTLNTTATADSFTYRVNDGTANSAAVTVNIVIGNNAPVAVAQGPLAMKKNVALTVILTGTDADPNTTLTFAISGTPANGSVTAPTALSALSAQATFTPTFGFTGTASFQFTVSDGISTSAAATVSFTVTNDTPVATSASLTVLRNTATSFQLAGTDANGDTLTFTIVGQPTKGAVTVSAATGAGTYTPTTGQTGADSFTFTVNDGTATSTAATVSVTINNTAPTIDASSVAAVSVARNTARVINLLANGNNPSETITFALGTAPTKGTITGFAAVAGSGAGSTATVAITYTPTTGQSGADSFTFTVSDGATSVTSSSVAITIAGNTAATIDGIGAQTVSKNVAKTIVLSAQGNDPGETLTFAQGTAPTKGTITGFTTVTGAGVGSAGSVTITYTPTLNASGTDSFTFTVTDGPGGGTVTSAAVSITIVNTAPVASAGAAISVNELSATAFSGATATDADPGDVLTIAWAVQGGSANGTLTGATTLTPTYTAPDLTAEASRAVIVTLTVTDTSGATSSSNKVVTVNRTLSVTAASFASKTLTITGTGFAAGATVKIDGVTTTISPVVGSSTTITLSGKRRILGIKPAGSSHSIQVIQGTNNSNVFTTTL